MAETDITVVVLRENVASADLPDASGTVATVPADGWNIKAGNITDRLLLKFTADGSGDTVTIEAGDYPLATRAGLGELDVTLAANDVKYIVVEGQRFLRDDGTILATCTDAGTTCAAFQLPK